MSTEEILQRLDTIKDDIRAEVLVDDVLTHYNADNEQILINFEGQFTRNHRHDILSLELTDFALDAKQVLRFHLSRDNIYQNLPEGITHIPKDDASGRSVQNMVNVFRAAKMQGETAKKFFSPFQNEIFFAGVYLENIEKKLFFGIDGSQPLEFQYQFWGLSPTLPTVLVARFMRMLPYKYKFTGNLPLIAECLCYLLAEEVTFTESGYKRYNDEHQGISLGDARLGIDFIAGSSFTDYSLHVHFTIGPLEKYTVTDFIHGGPVQDFLQLYFETFLPIEVETTTSILPAAAQEFFQIDCKTGSILGFTTRI
ncbi:MAG TPA: hypothetical protein VIU12_28850 [Chryseolinea sp.]